IESEGHFLAAGLTGEVQVFDDFEIQSGQGRPGPEGYLIASYLQEDEDPPWPVYGAIFAYEQGAMLADSTIAAGRRYFAGFNDMGTFYFTEDGWKLWHAAVDWALYRDQTSVEKDAPAPSGFRLHQNTPNPFNPATEISYEIPAAGHVRLVLVNTAGRLMELLADEAQEAGIHTVRLDASGLASGVYFCILESGSSRSSIKMMLLR
ncbi:T9SS type A sorting domain-containing protein, partial [bacterium]|nr:T9SS type A sorting domain-containing protein [bacterium]